MNSSESKFPRVLISTIPAWNQQSGANTFSTLLNEYPAEKLANIYTRAGLPDSSTCSRYFRIIENDVIKSIFNHRINTGSEVKSVKVSLNTPKEAKSEIKRYNFFTRHRWMVLLWSREILWKLGQWNSKDLDEFLLDFNPDVFLFHVESYWYFNRLNQYIISKVKPKNVVAFLWDDNFTYKQKPFSLLARLNRFITRRQVKRLISQSDKVLTICPKMKEECDKEFGVNSILITKPILHSNPVPKVYNPLKPIRIVYSGSLVIGRYKTISLLIKEIAKINKNGTRIFLDIYTQTSLSNSQITSLNIEGTSYLHGHLPQQEVFKEQEKADILLFVENLNNKFDNVARLSFSTKITDYLSRNRCILAIGPKDIAPMEYLKAENAAIICNSVKDIFASIYAIVNNPDMIQVFANNAKDCGQRNHSKDELLKRFYNSLLR